MQLSKAGTWHKGASPVRGATSQAHHSHQCQAAGRAAGFPHPGHHLLLLCAPPRRSPSPLRAPSAHMPSSSHTPQSCPPPLVCHPLRAAATQPHLQAGTLPWRAVWRQQRHAHPSTRPSPCHLPAPMCCPAYAWLLLQQAARAPVVVPPAAASDPASRGLEVQRPATATNVNSVPALVAMLRRVRPAADPSAAHTRRTYSLPCRAAVR